MFSEQEIEALVLGARWVSQRTDPQLASAALSLMGKIAAILPAEMRLAVESSALIVPPGQPVQAGSVDMQQVRNAIAMQRKVRIRYCDGRGQESLRLIWPFLLGYFEQTRVIAAWCEARNDFRHFRCDRLVALEILPAAMPRRRHDLAREWRARQESPGSR